MEREVRSFLKRAHVNEKEYGGRRFRFFEQRGRIVIVCGGIGPEAARRAAEAAIALYSPRRIYSAGFAGALDPALKVGDLIWPSRVIDARDGSSTTLPGRGGALVTFAFVANAAQKANLRDSFSAQAVDMEAAAVGRAAAVHRIQFLVIKAISDEADFEFPAMERFTDSNGVFSEVRFVCFAAARPWLWSRVLRMANNSRRAARALDHLRRYWMEPRAKEELPVIP